MNVSRIVAALMLALAATLGAAPAGAQSSYPERAIELIVTFPPGGPTDTAARLVQPALAANLKVPVVLVNKGGGGGALAMDGVAKARPDGYTLAATVRSTLSILPATQPSLSYRLKDFEVIGSYAASAQAITVRKDAPWKTLEELVDAVRKSPGKLSYGSAGHGTNSFFTMELLKLARGLDVVHVPFGGSGPLKNAILGGHVPIAASALSSMIPVIRSGDVIGLVISGDRRHPAVPEVPTMADKGVPEASLSTVMELYAPARTPKPIVERLAAVLAATMKDPAVVAALEKAGLEADYQTPEETRRRVEREHEVVLAAAKKLGLVK